MVKLAKISIAILVCLSACRPAPTVRPSRTPAATPSLAVPMATTAPASTPARTTVLPAPSSTLAPTPTRPATPTPTPVPFPTSAAAASELPAPPISLAVDPFDQLGIYALLANNTLYHTVDGGEQWRKVPLPVPERSLESALDPARPDALSATPQHDLVITRMWPRRIFLRVDQTLFRRSDGDPDWTPLLDRVAAWDVDEWEGELIFAWRSGEHTKDDPGGRQTHGLYKSKDSGETWTHVYKGFFPPLVQAQDAPGTHEGITALAIGPGDANILYAGADDGIYRSLTGGHIWTRFGVGLPDTSNDFRWTPLLVGGPEGSLYALTEVSPAADGHKAQTILARLEHGTTRPDEDHWTVVGSDVLGMLAGAQHGFWGVHTLAVDPDRPGRLYLGSEQGLWRSQDGGETWMPVNLGGGSDARPVGAVYRIAVRSGEETELIFWSDTGLHVHTVSTPTVLPETIVQEVQFETIGQVGGQSRAVAVTSGAIYLGIGPRIAGLGKTLRLAALGAFGFSPPLPGLVNDIMLDEDKQIAYVAAGEAGLLVVDVSFLPIARAIGQVETRYPARKVVVHESLAFVAEAQQTAKGGLSVIDVTIPDMPWLVAWHQLPGKPGGIGYANDTVHVAYGTGVVSIDVSDPANPVEASRTRLSHTISSLAIAGNTAYVTGDGLRVLDLTNPVQPRSVGYLNLSGYPLDDIVIAGHYAYAAQVFCEFGGCGSTLRILDISDPVHPAGVGTWFTQTAIEDLAVSSDMVYLASWQNGVEAVDVRDPAAPRQLDTYSTLGEVIDVVVEGGFAYVSDGAVSGLRVLDLSTSPRGRIWPTVRGTAEMRWANGYVVRDELAYVPVWGEGLCIVDVRDPDAPRELSVQDIGMAAQAIVADGVAYVSIYDGLVLLDVSDPAAPRERSRLKLEGSAAGLAVREGIAYVAVEETSDSTRGTLYVIDARDPGDPRQVGAVETRGSGLRVALVGNVAYVAVLDWSLPLPTGGVQTVDLTDPAQPRTIGFLALPGGAFDVQVSGQLAYIAAGEAGIYVADLSDPANLRLVGHLDTPGSARRVSIQEDRAYVADGAGGLLVLQIVQ
jgi:hypothetical protein